jgi:hypothetical protein
VAPQLTAGTLGIAKNRANSAALRRRSNPSAMFAITDIAERRI